MSVPAGVVKERCVPRGTHSALAGAVWVSTRVVLLGRVTGSMGRIQTRSLAAPIGHGGDLNVLSRRLIVFYVEYVRLEVMRRTS